jgi:hypothetical protein
VLDEDKVASVPTNVLFRRNNKPTVEDLSLRDLPKTQLDLPLEDFNNMGNVYYQNKPRKITNINFKMVAV